MQISGHFDRDVGFRPKKGQRVKPPDPRPEGRESRLFFHFLGRESTPEAKKGKKGKTLLWGGYGYGVATVSRIDKTGFVKS